MDTEVAFPALPLKQGEIASPPMTEAKVFSRYQRRHAQAFDENAADVVFRRHAAHLRIEAQHETEIDAVFFQQPQFFLLVHQSRRTVPSGPGEELFRMRLDHDRERRQILFPRLPLQLIEYELVAEMYSVEFPDRGHASAVLSGETAGVFDKNHGASPACAKGGDYTPRNWGSWLRSVADGWREV